MNATLLALINRAISLDRQAPQLLKKLNGASIAIHFKTKHFTKKILILINKTQIETIVNLEHPASVIIEGPPTAFLSLARHKNIQAAAKLGLSFEGEVAVLETLQTLFFSATIDWEEFLSPWTGDIAAHTLSQWVRTFGARKTAIINSTLRSTTEYLTEEIQYFPTRPEIDHFLDKVDTLRSDTDRLTLRMERLAHLLQQEIL